LAEEFGPHGFQISTEADPICDPMPNVTDNYRMRHILGINPIDVKKTIIDTVYSFFEYGILNPDPNHDSIKKTSFSFIHFNKK
jgi:hypothetical protein